MAVQDEWNNGYVVQPVRVTNAGTSTITGWTVTVTLPAGHTVTGSWRATLTTSGQTVTAHGVGYNSTITRSAVTGGAARTNRADRLSGEDIVALAK